MERVFFEPITVAGLYIPGGLAEWRVRCEFLPPGATRCILCNITLDLGGLFLVAQLICMELALAGKMS